MSTEELVGKRVKFVAKEGFLTFKEGDFAFIESIEDMTGYSTDIWVNVANGDNKTLAILDEEVILAPE